MCVNRAWTQILDFSKNVFGCESFFKFGMNGFWLQKNEILRNFLTSILIFEVLDCFKFLVGGNYDTTDFSMDFDMI